jgi:integrase
VNARKSQGGRGTKGYRVLPSGSYQVRVAGFPPEVVADELAATLRVAELRVAKRDGHALPTPAGSRFRTLGQAAEEFLAHKLAHGGKHGELTWAGAQHWGLATKPWRTGPLRNRPLRALTRGELQRVIDARTAKHRVSARNEAQALLAVLRHAQGTDIVFAASLLMIEVPKKTKRTRRDLTPAEFDFLLGFVDQRQRRMLELASTLGSRINELFLLERSWVDLGARRIRMPLEATKEKREKLLDLTHEEATLLREQLLDVYKRLGTDTPYVFPKPMGGRWRYGHFHEDVWAPAKQNAIKAWRREHGADPKDETAATPYDSVTLHTLRRTCVGWLRASNLPVEVIAQRLGHNDGGATLLRHYRYVREGEARAALDRLGIGVRAYLNELENDDEGGEDDPK